MKRIKDYFSEQLGSSTLYGSAALAGLGITAWGFAVGFLAESFGIPGEMQRIGIAIASLGFVALALGVALGDALVTAALLWVVRRRAGLGAWFFAAAVVLGAALAAFSLPSWLDAIYSWGKWVIAAVLFAKASDDARRFVRPATYLFAAFLLVNILYGIVLYLSGERIY